MGTPVEIKKLLEGQRAEAKQEQVRVTLGLGTQEGFYADIYNSGDVPVYIKEVALGREMGPNQTMRTPLLVATPMPVTDGKGSIAYVVLGQKNCDLRARKEARFLFPRFPSTVVQQMATCPQDNVWLSVSTYGGEIHRVGGEEVQPVLAELVKLWQAMEEAERPKVVSVVFYTHQAGSMKKEVGTIKAHLVKPGGVGPYQVRLDPISGLSISREEGDQLAKELVNNKAIGRLGEYEWRVE
jgi:hypothetical protein